MKANLDTLRTEIREYLESRNIAVFHGVSRGAEEVTVYWDMQRHPDFREFVSAAEAAGIRLITLHAEEFSDDVIDDALERVDESALSREERRTTEARLREMRGYTGFVCQIELTFDLGSRVYMFELRTDWYNELNDLLYSVDDAFEGEEEGDGGDALGSGYFSKN